MPRPAVDLYSRIRQIPRHQSPLPEEAAVPLLHYKRSANDFWNLVLYFDRNVDQANVYQAAFERHIHRLCTMVLLSLVEAFERFLKEIAAVCVDQVGQMVLDDRLKVFRAAGDVLASHFAPATLGKSLCESSTWVDCDQVNGRFGRILADPFSDHNAIELFAKNLQNVDHWRYETMSTLWQLRHAIVHNAGVITQSDAVRLRLLTRSHVDSPRILWPTKGDVWYVKLFLDETAEGINNRVADRLATLLGMFHVNDPTLFVLADRSQEVANLFGVPVTVGGVAANPTI